MNPTHTPWPETQWDRVIALHDPAAKEEALKELCESYREVILVLCKAWDPQEGEDLAQAFFLWLIEKRRLELADPARGQFRKFLSTLLYNFLRKAHRAELALKRGGGAVHVDWAAEAAEELLAPDLVFDRTWANRLMKEVLSALVKEAAGSGIKAHVLQGLLPSLLAEEDARDEAWTVMARRLSIPAGTLRSQATRLRLRFRELIQREVSRYTSGSDLEAEIRYLMQCLGGDEV